MVDTPFGSFEDQRDFGARKVDIASELEEHLPDFDQAARNATNSLLALVAQVVGDQPTHRAVRLLFNLAANDFLDLLGDLKRGSGRSAMRATRSLIEHAINMNVVTGSLAEASRYLEHLDQGAAILLDLEPGAAQVSAANKKAGKLYRHALRKAGGPATRRFASAVAQHGPSFRRSWSAANLFDQSVSCGLDHLYPYYKLASLVVHGSSGGTLGTLRDDDSAGFSTFRTGPALELAPVAMWAGIAAFREVLSGLVKARPDIDLAEYSRGLDDLASVWVYYFLLLMEIDRDLWPREQLGSPGTVLAFTRLRARRWYLHVPSYGLLLEAEEPVLSDDVEAQIEEMIDHALEQPELFRSDQRWVSAAMTHVLVKVREEAVAIPDTALLQTSSSGWDLRTVSRAD